MATTATTATTSASTMWLLRDAAPFFPGGRCDRCGSVKPVCCCDLPSADDLDCPMLQLWATPPDPQSFREVANASSSKMQLESALAAAGAVCLFEFEKLVKARVNTAREASRCHVGISWLHFNFTGNRMQGDLIQHAMYVCTVSRSAYIGVTMCPNWRWLGSSNSTMIPHSQTYSQMWLLEAGGSHQIATLECLLIDTCRHLPTLRNKISGGGHVRKTANSVWFLYLATEP